MSRRMHFVAVCRYPGKDTFRFFSPTFVVDAWADLERVAADVVAQAWAAISPHPAPPVVDYLPGMLEYVRAEA